MNLTLLTHLMLNLTSVPRPVNAPDGYCYDFSLDSSGYLRFLGRYGDYENNKGMGLYKMHADVESWDDAEEVCKEEGGHLAVIESSYEAQALQRILLKWYIDSGSYYTHAFVGCNDREREGQWMTVLGDSVLESGYFFGWNPGEPNNGKSEDCCEYGIRGGMNDVSCSSPRAFICEKPAMNYSPATEDKTSWKGIFQRATDMDLILVSYLVTCLSSPEAWEEISHTATSFEFEKDICAQIKEGQYRYPNAEGTYRLPLGMGLYQFNNVTMTWLDATKFCADKDSHLVIIETSDEAAVLSTLIWFEHSLDQTTYVGYHDIIEEGSWETVLGEPVITSGYYLNWATNEPNDVGNEDCALLKTNGRLEDVNCNTRRPFICEKPLRKVLVWSGCQNHGTIKNMWLMFIPSLVLYRN